jgi:surface antigen
VFGSGRSYIGEVHFRQSSLFSGAVLCAFAALSLAGCASMGMPAGPGGTDPVLTGSIKAAPAGRKTARGADPSDWTAVRATLAKAGAGGEIAWSNPATGSSGTVSLGPTLAKVGAACRSFATTINDARGVRSYRGEACRSGDGAWKIADIVADDQVLL